MAMPPATLKVGPRVYTVATDPETYRRVCDQQEKALEGHSNHATELIMLRPGRGACWTAETLVHEAMHAALSLHGVSLHNVKELEDLEEYVVTVASPIWLMIMQDNPDLLAFVLKPEVPWEVDGTQPPAARREPYIQDAE